MNQEFDNKIEERKNDKASPFNGHCNKMERDGILNILTQVVELTHI